MATLKTVDLQDFGDKYSGKVRDYYIVGNKRILITTDRLSAFDHIIGCIPEKGKVLNLLAAFWFEKTHDIIKNHLISVPDPNVTIAQNAQPIPIEMVVRGYITGVTSTSIWGSYEKGDRLIYGLAFSDGLRKNQKLPQPIITPTTKAEEGHDERLTREDILLQKIIPEETYSQMEDAALKLFERGTEVCGKSGIILVDTKYEFGLLDDKLILIDEMHTPDSSRFWIQSTYDNKFAKGEEPENFDKEMVRMWLKEQGYSGDGKIPPLTEEFMLSVSKRYQNIFTKITHTELPETKGNIEERIKKNLKRLE